jgi:flagellar hook assembly protein FlgD
MKRITSMLLVLVFLCGLFTVDVHGASSKFIKQTYVGQPTDANHADYDKALYIKVQVAGYKGKNLRIRIKSSDGTELKSLKLSTAVSDDTNYFYYWDGKDANGNFYKDGTYTIQTWIYGDDSTLVTKSYELDLKGNGSTPASSSNKFIKQTYVGQPTDASHKDYNKALYIKVQVAGYKGKNLRIRIKSSDGTELKSIKLSTAVSDDTNYFYYWDGKDANGNYYKDGTYTIQTWIYGDDSTLVTKSYKLDLKGNGGAPTAAPTTAPTAAKKSATVTYMGQPNDPNNKHYNYAMLTKAQINGYKDKTAIVELYDPTGRHVKTFEFLVASNTYTMNCYWDGYDYNGFFCNNGKYTAKLYVYGYESDTEQDWQQNVTLKTTNAKFIRINGLVNTEGTSYGKTVKVATAGYNGKTIVAGYYDIYGTYNSLGSWTLKTNDVQNWTLKIAEVKTYGSTGKSITVCAYVDGSYDTTYVSMEYKVS